MKHIVKIGLALVVLGLVVSCASAPAENKAPASTAATPKVSPVTPIQHQGTLLGTDIPLWVTVDEADLENDPRYKDYLMFRIEAIGENLNGTKLIASRLNADTEVARMISLRVQNLFSGAQIGDDKTLETYFENIVKSLADATVSGWRKFGDFWVQYEYTATKKQEYRVYVLYGIPKDTVKKLIDGAIEGVQTDTPEKVTAKDRVKAITQASLPSLTEDQRAAQ